MDLAGRGCSVVDARDARARRAAEREVQPRRGAHDGAVPPPRRRAPTCATPACRRTIRTTSSSAPRSPAPSWRASTFPAGATATPTRAAPTAGGRRPSRRTASTRSTSSRSCSRTPRRMPGVTILNRDAGRPASRRTSDGVTSHARDLDSGARAHDPRPLPRRLRRRPLAVRKAIGASLRGHAGDPARAVDLHPRAGAARRSFRGERAWCCYAMQPAPQRHLLRHRRPRDLARPQPPACRASPISMRSTATRSHPRHPRRRRRLRVRGPQQGRLDRPPPRRRPLSRPPRLHLRRRRAPVGAVRRLRHERRHRRCDEPVVAPRGAPRTAGPTSDPRRLRDRAPADHRAGVALRDGPRAADDQGARRRAGARSRSRAPKATRIRAERRPRGLRAQRAAVLLRRPELRLLLRPLAADRLRRRGGARLHDGRLHALDGAGLPRAAFLAAPTAARSTTRSAATTRCCASTPASTRRRCSRPRRARRVPLALLDVRARRRAGRVPPRPRPLPRRPARRLARRRRSRRSRRSIERLRGAVPRSTA